MAVHVSATSFLSSYSGGGVCLLEAPDADNLWPPCAQETQGPPKMCENTSSFTFLQIKRSERDSPASCGTSTPLWCLSKTALRWGPKSRLISVTQKRHFVLDFGRSGGRGRGGGRKQQDVAWEEAGGWRGSHYDTLQSNFGHQEKTKRSFISFFDCHHCQLWFLWPLLKRQWSYKEHFGRSTQPGLGSEIAFVSPPPPPLTSICPEKSTTAGKALETKGAGVACLRAPVLQAIDCESVYLVRNEHDDHVSPDRSRL